MNNIAQRVGNGFNALGGALNNVQNFVSQPNPYPNLQAPIPIDQMVSRQLPQNVQSPIPQQQVVQHVLGPTPLQNTMNNIGSAFNQAGNNAQQWGRMFGIGAPQQSIGTAISTQAPRVLTTPSINQQTPYQPNITIPYSLGGQKTLPPQIAQPILNVFNPINQATNAAQILNHPPQITAIGNEQQQGINTVPNRGENASFKTNNIDRTNTDGSVDRGLFRINSNTFNGIMQDPHWGQAAKKFGINNFDDMNDPQKNSFMARLIYEREGWKAWYAGAQSLRTQGAPNLAQLSQMLKK